MNSTSVIQPGVYTGLHSGGSLKCQLNAYSQHFSDYSEAYVEPGDIMTKRADFLAETERLREEGPMKLSLANLQGTLLLHER